MSRKHAEMTPEELARLPTLAAHPFFTLSHSVAQIAQLDSLFGRGYGISDACRESALQKFLSHLDAAEQAIADLRTEVHAGYTRPWA